MDDPLTLTSHGDLNSYAQGNLFSQKGDELKGTKEAERGVRMVLGASEGVGDEPTETVLLAMPAGDEGSIVAMPVTSQWLIGRIGRLGGEYTIVGQVDRVLNEGEELPTLRLTNDVAATPLELTVMKQAVSNFVEPAKALGVTILESDASIVGPALWLEPIAIFR